MSFSYRAREEYRVRSHIMAALTFVSVTWTNDIMVMFMFMLVIMLVVMCI